jgi:hypothetical protein
MLEFAAVHKFPEGKRFAFSVFDDTDFGTVDNLRPVYSLLAELGLRTTKSVWPLPGDPAQAIGGETLADPGYRAFILELQAQGFEIALHNASNHDNTRAEVEAGLAVFRDALGRPPRCHANHQGNRDNLYWGSARLRGGIPRFIYDLATRGRRRTYFTGHVPGDARYWGDLARQMGLYVRNLVFDEVNLDAVNPTLPYHDPGKPDVAWWFSSCDGGDLASFCSALSPRHQQRLEDEGGVCIMYTHFGHGFAEQGRPAAAFEQALRGLAARPGWFVPVSTLLDHLRAERGAATGDIPPAELARMEWRWLREKLRKGTG